MWSPAGPVPMFTAAGEQVNLPGANPALSAAAVRADEGRTPALPRLAPGRASLCGVVAPTPLVFQPHRARRTRLRTCEGAGDTSLGGSTAVQSAREVSSDGASAPRGWPARSGPAHAQACSQPARSPPAEASVCDRPARSHRTAPHLRATGLRAPAERPHISAPGRRGLAPRSCECAVGRAACPHLRSVIS